MSYTKKPAHTPGPWRVTIDGDEVTASLPGVIEGSKSVCHTHNPLKPQSEREANARLIAAAPELLEALRAALEAQALGLEWESQAQRAIKKATGGAA